MWSLTKLIGLNYNLSDSSERLKNIDKEMINKLDLEKIENDVLESAREVEFHHVLME